MESGQEKNRLRESLKMSILNNIDVKQLSGQYFKEGYNCAEAILRAFREKLSLDLSDEAIKMASGFGSGIGEAGCLCGALSSSVMVLGILQGRSDKSQSKKPIYSTVEEFHHLFSEKFGSSCCHVLNPHPYETRAHLLNCLKLTGNTASLLIEYIEDKNLYQNSTYSEFL